MKSSTSDEPVEPVELTVPLASNNKKMQRLSQLEEQYSTQRLGPVKGLFLGRGNFDPLAATNRGKPNQTGWRGAYFEKHHGQPRVRVKDCGSRFHTVLEAAEHIIKMNEVSRQASAAAASRPGDGTAGAVGPGDAAASGGCAHAAGGPGSAATAGGPAGGPGATAGAGGPGDAELIRRVSTIGGPNGSALTLAGASSGRRVRWELPDGSPKPSRARLHTLCRSLDPLTPHHASQIQHFCMAHGRIAFAVDDFLEQSMMLAIIGRLGNWKLQSTSLKILKECRLASLELATLIWQRLQPLSDWVVFAEERDADINQNSRWVPHGISPDFTVFSYQGLKQRFKRHQDGTKTDDHGRRSFCTVLIYLNEPSKGGQSVLYHDSSSDAAHIISPTVGRCLVFRHSVWHSAWPATEGTKVVLRADVMFNEQKRRGR